MTTGILAFGRRAALRAALRGALAIGLAASAALALADRAAAQTDISPDGGSVVVGDVAESGFAVRFLCSGVDKEIHLLSGRDLQNAYGRALGGGGRVSQVAFSADGGRATVDLEVIGGPENIRGAETYVYRVIADRRAARAFADALLAGRILTVDRFDGRVLTDGLEGALNRQEALCPF